MKKGKTRDPVELLLRRPEKARVISFFKELSEQIALAFSDAAQTVPAEQWNRPAVAARGHLRRYHLDLAMHKAASKVGFPIVTYKTSPATWSYSVVRIGAFSLTLGIVQRIRSRCVRRLRTRGNYAYDLVERNEPINPQGSLLDFDRELDEVLPDGTFGAFVVAEPSVYVPDSPLYIGFLVPSPNLRRAYFSCSIEQLIVLMQERLNAERRPSRKVVERKQPKLKKQPKRPSGD